MKTSISIELTPQEDRELRLIVRRQKAPYREVVRASKRKGAETPKGVAGSQPRVEPREERAWRNPGY